ncbi:MAG: carotenoid oxygenase family protein, partial [Gammaproteobacteria bacterium]
PRGKEAPEGDGYIIGLCNRYVEKRTDLLVMDAQHLDEGPIATVKLPFALRNGIHGHWVPGYTLPVK